MGNMGKTDDIQTKKEGLGLPSPWVQYANAVRALFRYDEDVSVEMNDDDMILKIKVIGSIKADALSKLLPEEKTWGNVKLKINVIPANSLQTRSDLYRKALYGNPALSSIIEIPMMASNTYTYVMFEPEVVQYYNDNLGDPHGNRTTLYEELAREVFDDQNGIFFSTDVDDFDDLEED